MHDCVGYSCQYVMYNRGAVLRQIIEGAKYAAGNKNY